MVIYFESLLEIMCGKPVQLWIKEMDQSRFELVLQQEAQDIFHT